MTYRIAEIPDAMLPQLDELNGDIRMLADMVGVRMALEISELFDSTSIRLYGHKAVARKYRDQQIRAEYDRGGVTVNEVARRHHVSERHVYNVLGQADGPQLRLF